MFFQKEKVRETKRRESFQDEEKEREHGIGDGK